MQTLTRNELTWTCIALERELQHQAEAIREADRAGLAGIAELARVRHDGIRATLNKLQTALDNHSKRIAIK